jgi:hypothetical protein
LEKAGAQPMLRCYLGIVHMLLAAFYLMSAAVMLGMGLSLFHLGVVSWRSWIVAALHGMAGAIGLGVLIFALKGPAYGFANGVESFGKIAVILAAVALAGGIIILFRPAFARRGWPIGAHATLGIAAYVFLSGYLLLG